LLFERIINLVHQRAPNSRIAFNTTPSDTAEAARRWIARCLPPKTLTASPNGSITCTSRRPGAGLGVSRRSLMSYIRLHRRRGTPRWIRLSQAHSCRFPG
jgi:hypothetical protein